MRLAKSSVGLAILLALPTILCAMNQVICGSVGFGDPTSVAPCRSTL